MHSRSRQRRGMEEDEVDRLRLPQARKEAKTRGIDISNLKNIGEIRCTLKRHSLIDRKTRDNVKELILLSVYPPLMVLPLRRAQAKCT